MTLSFSSATAPDSFSGCSDVLIAGGGIVGFALAAAIKAAVGPALRVEIRDSGARAAIPPQRVSALAASSRRMLQELDVWSAVAPRAEPVIGMDITDSRLEDVVRPLLLSFEPPGSDGEPMAHIVHNAVIEEALERRAAALGVVTRRQAVAEARAQRDFVEVASPAGELSPAKTSARTRLLVAADGMRSPLREAMGVSLVGWDYEAEATVCTVVHERPHDGRARQHFLPEGPFAILPLSGRSSSIVWSAPKALAQSLARLSPEAFEHQLTIRFGRELGEIAVADAPLRFALRFQLARRFAARRFALVGDAAHAIHPLAGQGLNLGLRDAAALAATSVGQARLGLDPGERDALEDFERARRFETVAMAAANDALHRLFAAEGLARPARDWGLGLVDRSSAIKRALMREAEGSGSAPSRRASDRSS